MLTAIPSPLWVLLIGRALQGLGLGVVALLMSAARDHLPDDRAQATIATVSVASTVGIGVAYPLMGFVDQVLGLRAAYGLGALLSVAAVVIAWIFVSRDSPRPAARLDLAGAALLGVGMLGVLLMVAEPSIWCRLWVAVAIPVVTAGALAAWVLVERRGAAPLVDLRLFVRGGVLRANIAMLASDVGMYLLFSLLTRYVQTPADAGYGFGLSGVAAGAALIPFSVLGFVAGRLNRRLIARLSARSCFAVYAAAAILFAAVPQSLVGALAAMAVLGFGVGGVSAVMPRLVLDGLPQRETSSVLSINQVIRSIGFSMGSALAGILLAAATAAPAQFPDQHGFSLAALCVLPLLLAGTVAVVPGGPRRGRS